MKTLASIIKNDGVAVIKTDTLYGLVGNAENRSVVDKIYRIKKRNILKPVVVLIPNLGSIEKFGITIDEITRKKLNEYWPGKVSILLPVSDTLDLHYIHKGTGYIAFRIPDDKKLIDLLKETGPLVAPSANVEGNNPAKNIKEAMLYFGDDVNYYDDQGDCIDTKASKIIKILNDGKIEIIRK